MNLLNVLDAVLFSYLVDLKDNNITHLRKKSYEDIYRDVRSCVDLCHRDGVIKDTVVNDPSSYVIYDEDIVPMLKRLRQAGKRVSFILTFKYNNLIH